jgi:hypothetical protein
VINFPDAPTNGQQFTAAGASWRWDGTKWAAYGGGSSSGDVGRNLIHNSLFNIAQRGTGPWTASGSYTLDRWIMWFAGGTMSVNRGTLSDADRTGIGDDAARTGIGITTAGTAGAGDATFLVQNIEDARRMAGKSVTVSFYANSTVASFKLGISLDQGMGTGGSPSADVSGTGQSVTLSATIAQWARYSLTFIVPSLTGKVLGTNGNDKTQLNFWFSAGSGNAAKSGNVGVQSGGINIWGVQLEIGSTATPLEKPDPQQDLAKCQRFYQIGTVGLWGAGTAGGQFGLISNLPVTMRAAPTVTLSSTGLANCTGPAGAGASPGSVQILANVTATAATAITTNYTASADL